MAQDSVALAWRMARNPGVFAEAASVGKTVLAEIDAARQALDAAAATCEEVLPQYGGQVVDAAQRLAAYESQVLPLVQSCQRMGGA